MLIPLLLLAAAALQPPPAPTPYTPRPNTPLPGNALPPVAGRPLPPPERPETADVEVAGKRFEVATYRDGSVTISGGDPASPHTPAVMTVFATAAARTSGCRLRNSYWSDNDVRGTLDCSARTIP